MMRIKIFLICLSLLVVSCFRFKESSIEENTIYNSASLFRMNYLPKIAKLYLYEPNTSFNNLVLKVDSIKPLMLDKEVSIRFSSGYFNFSLMYDYRIIVDDTLCFDISEFKIIPDTMGRTMRGWAVRAKLLSFRCNDSVLANSKYNFFELPFESRRIVKKGQYDE